jgi:hypothetical protein
MASSALRHLGTLASLCAAAALFYGCSAIEERAAASWEKGFRTSFKSSFIKSCRAHGGSGQRCGCVERVIERKFNDEQLLAMTAPNGGADTAVGDAARICAAHHDVAPAVPSSPKQTSKNLSS